MDTQFATGIVDVDDSYDAGRQAAATAVGEIETDSVDFCQVFSSSRYEYDRLTAGVRSEIGTDAELIGCSSYGEFTEEAVTNDGVVVSVVTSDDMVFYTGLGHGVSENVGAAVREAVNELPSDLPAAYPHEAAINLHNGIAGVSEQIALQCRKRLGPSVSLAGGSAGEDGFAFDQVEVFRNGEVSDDGVVLALIGAKKRPIMTVNHGHEPISEALEVTDSDGGLVRELDGEPAYEVWKGAVRDRAARDHDQDVDAFTDSEDPDLYALAAVYEFAINQGDGYKVRAFMPESIEDGSLGFFVDIPEGTVLRVMESSPAEVEKSGLAAADEAAELAGDTEIAGAFVYECAVRQILLQDEFDEYIHTLGDNIDCPFAGFETYGEMCMERGQLSGYHNSTAVFVLLPA